jgi:predicted RNase H-like nuclease (RuvC/YqgF family)
VFAASQTLGQDRVASLVIRGWTLAAATMELDRKQSRREEALEPEVRYSRDL